MDRFAQILFDLGKEIGTELYPDENRICQINYQDEIHLQIQYDETNEQLLFASFLCDVPPGKYREKLLRAALRSNGEYPRLGILAYSERNNQLTLFEYVPAANIMSTQLFQFLQNFIEKAVTWKNAVEKGLPLPVTPPKNNKDSSMFGLKP